MRAASLALVSAALASGCSFDRGEAIGTVRATFAAALERPADRELGDGFLRLASDFEVRVVRMELVVDDLILEAASGEVAAGFDPANPPEGYGLCHNGHCHADDGRLVDYEDIAAELAGGEGGTTVAVAFGPRRVDLVGGAREPLDCGTCALDDGRLVRARLTASRLELELEVRDGRAAPRIEGVVPVRGTIDLASAGDDGAPPPGQRLAALDELVGEDEPPVVAIDLGLEVSPRALDGIDFAALPLVGDALDAGAAAEALRAGIGEAPLTAAVERHDD